MLPTVTTLKGFKVRLGIATKETIETEQWPSPCSSIRTDPSHQALHPKSNYMPQPNEIGALLFNDKPNQHSSQPIRYRNDRDNNPSS